MVQGFATINRVRELSQIFATEEMLRKEDEVTNMIQHSRKQVELLTKTAKNLNIAVETFNLNSSDREIAMAELKKIHPMDFNHRSRERLALANVRIFRMMQKLCHRINKLKRIADSTVEDLKAIKETVIDHILGTWKHEQQIFAEKQENEIASWDWKYSFSLSVIHGWCTDIVGLIWVSYKQLKDALKCLEKTAITKQNNGLILPLYDKIDLVSALLQCAVEQCFIVVSQPPLHVEELKIFSSPVTVALLIWDKSLRIYFKNTSAVQTSITYWNPKHAVSPLAIINGMQLMKSTDRMFKASFNRMLLKSVGNQPSNSDPTKMISLKFTCDVVIEDLEFSIHVETNRFLVATKAPMYS